jgi:hypothetical protein
MTTTYSSSTHPNNNAIPTTTINVPSTDRNHGILPTRSIKTLIIIIIAAIAMVLILISIICFLSIWKNRNGNNNFSGKFSYPMTY